MAREVINPEQDAIDELITLLRDLFPDAQVYDTKVEMDLEPPCFLIYCTNSKMTRRVTNEHFFYDMSFEIVFFPGSDLMPEIAIRDVEFPLIMALECFGEDSTYLYRADNIRSSVADGLLYIKFEIQRIIHLVVDKPKIKDIKEDIYVEEI